VSGPGSDAAEYARSVQRRALGVLFTAIAVSLALIAVWSALSGGRAWVIAFAAGALALWMGDLARRVWPW
jgi:F0F1-type ATP synthase assembly protein I